MLTLHPAVGDGAPPPPVRGRRRRRQRRGDRLRGDRGVRHGPRTRRWCRSGPPSRSPAPPTARRSRSPTTSRPRAWPSAPPPAAPGSRPVARMEQVVGRVQDLMPRRKPAYRRVTPLASRRETQRRAALAVLALVVVVGGLGLGGLRLRRPAASQEAISSVNAGQQALDTAQANLAKVTGPGVDLVADDPTQAHGAPDRGVPAARRRRGGQRQRRGHRPAAQAGGRRPRPPLRRRPGGRRRRSSRSRRPRAPSRSTWRRWSRDPTAPRTSSTARPRPSTGSTSRPRRPRSSRGLARRPSDATVATPRFLAVGGLGPAHPRLEERRCGAGARRTRPGKGTLTRIKVSGSASWGDDVTRASAPSCRTSGRGLYNLYVVDPSEQQIRAYSPAADGSGFPAASTAWLATARPVDGMSVAVHRRRPVRRRGRRCSSGSLGQERRLEGQVPGDDAAPAPPRVLADRRAVRSGATASSTSTTSRTAGSSRSTRPTATTWPSTGSPATHPTGTTCARCRHPGRRGRPGDADVDLEGRASTRRCSRPSPTPPRRRPRRRSHRRPVPPRPSAKPTKKP